ncbi:MAG: Gfo/Idh/MocA family oxidoreductase, partial [Bacteroidales bacterium]|nr:Gfo/Idh/MocA family oxidoreductase [Bacteroidales bacterium]
SAEKGNIVPDENCYLGFDAYEKVLASDVDIVLLVTPTHFRPQHFKAAVAANKHIFMEKPCAVDPVGVRTVLAAAKQAKAAGLTVVTGNQRHHRKDYWEAYIQVQNGAIGDILSGACHWDMGNIWEVQRQPGWSDMEYCIRDWFNSKWVSGDSMLDLMVHNLDVLTWFMGGYPQTAIGYGGCARKKVGDTYDYFSIDYMLDKNRPMLVTTRQIDGCQTRIGEFLRGTKGSAILNDVGEMKLLDNDGKVIWEYKDANGKPLPVKNPYEQEHIHLVESVRKNLKLNQAEILALATLAGIMGREAAYTGKEITWDEIMASTLRLGPEEYKLGPLSKDVYNPGHAPLPGTDPKA